MYFLLKIPGITIYIPILQFKLILIYSIIIIMSINLNIYYIKLGDIISVYLTSATTNYRNV